MVASPTRRSVRPIFGGQIAFAFIGGDQWGRHGLLKRGGDYFGGRRASTRRSNAADTATAEVPHTRPERLAHPAGLRLSPEGEDTTATVAHRVGALMAEARNRARNASQSVKGKVKE